MIVATRTLTAICKSGEKKALILTLEAPIEQDGIWTCWYQIEFPEDEHPAETRRSFAGGVDALDALQMGIMKLGVDLHFTTYHRDGRLFWEDGREGYGLMVPKAARDLLKGDDALYFG